MIPHPAKEKTDAERLNDQLSELDVEANNNKKTQISKKKSPTLKAVLGWADPTVSSDAGPKNKSLFNFIRNSKKTLILHLTKYKVNFQQNGQTSLDLTFYANLENDLKRGSSDVFATQRPDSDDGATIEIAAIADANLVALKAAEFRNGKTKLEIKRKLDEIPESDKAPYIKITSETIDRDIRRLDILKQVALLEKNTQAENKIDNTLGAMRDLQTRVKFQTTGKKRRILLNKLTKKARRESGTLSNKLYEFVVPGHEVGFSYKTGQMVKQYNFEKLRSTEESKKKTVPFLFFRDILDVAAEVGLSEKGNIILGTIPAVGFPRNRMSIGDLPIALDTFTSWFNQVVGDPDRKVLPFHLFLSKMLDIISRTARNASAASGWTQGELPTLSYNFITLSDKHFRNLVSGAKLTRKDVLTSDRQSSKTSANSNVQSGERIDITSGNTSKGTLAGNYEKDVRRGIYHFMVGADRGPLQTINFTEMDNQHYKTHLITSARSKSTSIAEELALPQNVTMTLKGNNLLATNTLIYVNATLGLGREVADQLRLGGYYRVTTVQQSFNAQGWTTDVAAKWQQKAVDED